MDSRKLMWPLSKAAWDVYNKIRLSYPAREIPGANFEGATCFRLPSGLEGRETLTHILLIFTEDEGVLVIEKETRDIRWLDLPDHTPDRELLEKMNA